MGADGCSLFIFTTNYSTNHFSPLSFSPVGERLVTPRCLYVGERLVTPRCLYVGERLVTPYIEGLSMSWCICPSPTGEVRWGLMSFSRSDQFLPLGKVRIGLRPGGRGKGHWSDAFQKGGVPQALANPWKSVYKSKDRRSKKIIRERLIRVARCYPCFIFLTCAHRRRLMDTMPSHWNPFSSLDIVSTAFGVDKSKKKTRISRTLHGLVFHGFFSLILFCQ